MERNDNLADEFLIDLGSATEQTRGHLGPVQDSVGTIPVGLSDD